MNVFTNKVKYNNRQKSTKRKGILKDENEKQEKERRVIDTF